jgi:hypothetical protein
MPVNGLSTGRDVTLVIASAQGTYQFPITNFTSRQMVTKIKSRLLNGPPIHGNIPDGWGGEFNIDRVDSSVDDAFAVLETAFYNGIDTGQISITETITESSGYTQYRYNGVQMELTQAGDWTGDAKVTQKISWEGSTRTKLQ